MADHSRADSGDGKALTVVFKVIGPALTPIPSRLSLFSPSQAGQRWWQLGSIGEGVVGSKVW